MLQTFSHPCWRSQAVTWALRTPVWQKTTISRCLFANDSGMAASLSWANLLSGTQVTSEPRLASRSSISSRTSRRSGGASVSRLADTSSTLISGAPYGLATVDPVSLSRQPRQASASRRGTPGRQEELWRLPNLCRSDSGCKGCLRTARFRPGINIRPS